MEASKIEYLIKFIPEEIYVDRLISMGELYMRPLAYYAELEKEQGASGRGDIREGLLLNCVKNCNDFPIYCMYAVFNKDLISDGILINKNAIKDFLSETEKGSFAVINYSDFISYLSPNIFDGYTVTANIVNYGLLNWETQKQLFMNDRSRAAYIKQTSFSHQQEYRLLVHMNLPIIEDMQRNEDYKKVHGKSFDYKFYKYDKYIKRIGSLQHCANKFTIKDLINYDDTYFRLRLKN